MARKAVDKLLLSATHLAKPLGFVFSFFLSKAKPQRFCGLSKHAQANEYSNYRPICYSHCCQQLFFRTNKRFNFFINILKRGFITFKYFKVFFSYVFHIIKRVNYFVAYLINFNCIIIFWHVLSRY